MNINGPTHNKTVHIPAHDVEVLDEDAYWNLDYQGNLADPEDDLLCLYSKTAWPTLAEAQRQFRLEVQAREQERAEAQRRNTQRRRDERQAQKNRAAEIRKARSS